jgi:hypothetical protein
MWVFSVFLSSFCACFYFFHRTGSEQLLIRVQPSMWVLKKGPLETVLGRLEGNDIYLIFTHISRLNQIARLSKQLSIAPIKNKYQFRCIDSREFSNRRNND